MDKETQNKAKSLVLVSGFVFEILALIAIGFFGGRWLDKTFQTSPLWTVSFMLVLMFFGIIRLIIRINRMEDSDGTK